MKLLASLCLLFLFVPYICCLPVASFYYLSYGNQMLFKAEPSLGNVNQYIWDFGDGTGSFATNERSISYYYPRSSLWQVKLTVVDSTFRKDSSTKWVISPLNARPKCDFKIISIVNDGISLDASASYDVDGFISLFRWNFNSGNLSENSDIYSSSSPITQYSYLKGGYYNISLEVMDNSRSNSTVCSKTVFVNHAPIPSFVYSINDHKVQLDGSGSQDPDGSITRCQWTFEQDGLVETSVNTFASHYYVLSGYYNISLNVTDNLGNYTVLTQTILIDIPPRAQFDIVSNYEDGLVLTAGRSWTDNNSHIVTSIWDWGDGTKQRRDNIHLNITHNYTLGSYYNVSLTVIDNYGKNNTYSQIIFVNAVPKVKFQALHLINDTIRLRSESMDLDGEITNLVWTMGDGKKYEFTKEEEFVHTYELGGTYNICLTVTDNLNAMNSSCEAYFANRAPTASFQVIENLNDYVIMKDNGSQDFDGNLTEFIWNWGDTSLPENTGTSKLAVHNYTWGGFYNVSLTVVDNLRAIDTQYQTIRVNTPPISLFEVVSSVNTSISLTSSPSQDIDGMIMKYIWDFGDGKNLTTNAASEFIKHTYKYGGFYIITLTVVDNMNDTHSFAKMIFVDTPPLAEFEVIGVLDHDWVVVSAKPFIPKFTNTRDVDGQVISLIWNFGDNTGNITNSTHTTQFHQYIHGGNYTITLYAQDNNAIYSQKVERTVFVNRPPIPQFVISNFEEGAVITLDGSSSYDSDGSISIYCWKMGDATEESCSNNATFQYSYSRSGAYSISLHVIDNLGSKSLIPYNETVTVNQQPMAFFQIAEPLPGRILTFESSQNDSIDFDGYIVKFIWDFGDGSMAVSTTLNSSKVTHQYKESGFYNVTLTVFDNAGANDSLTLPTVVFSPESDNPPFLDPGSDDFLKQVNTTIESYTPNITPIPHIQVAIEDSQTVFLSSQGSYDPDGKIISQKWNLGDNTYSTEKAFSHAYLRGGPFNITLTVTDNAGDSVTISKQITLNYLPIPIFEWRVLADNCTLTLDASKSFDPDGTIIGYNWTFGDGKQYFTTNKLRLNYTYTTAGLFTINLTVQDNQKMTAFYSQNVNLNPWTSSRVEITSGLPTLLLLKNIKANKYLAFTYNGNFSITKPAFLANQLIETNSDGLTTNPYLALQRGYQDGDGYYLYNLNNGLTLSIDETVSQPILSKQATSSFRIFSENNFYQLVDSVDPNKYLVISNSEELTISRSPSDNNHWWSIIPIQNPAFRSIPLN